MPNEANLLIVDDDENVAVTLQAILELEGYRVSIANNPEEARLLIEGQTFHTALIDLRLGNSDGIEVLEELRARHPNCSPIVLTGYASLDSAIAAIRKGAYDYLIKPCDLQELKLTVGRAVEREAMARALQERLLELEAANATIQKFADELQERVNLATAELREKVDELAQAKQGLEVSQQQREQFVSMIAHELGQPLTALTAYGQILNRPSVAREIWEDARATFVSETRRLGRLVHDLADVSNVIAGRFHVLPAQCDLVSIAREQVGMAQASTTNHTIVLEAPAGVQITGWYDPDRVAQVLSNLLTNAIKYTDGGTITVRVEADRDCARITVRDEGPGIASPRIETIFEPNFRLPPTEGKRQPGMGLGLYITKAIVDAHKGEIEVRTAKGKGAEFTILLPTSVLKASEPATSKN